MIRLDIEECNDIEKLRALCMEQYKQLFYIGETLVAESKWNISKEVAIERISGYLVDNQYNCNKILEGENDQGGRVMSDYMYPKPPEIAELRIAPTEKEMNDILQSCGNMVGLDWKKEKEEKEKN